VDNALSDINHLFIIADGPLESLPFGLLISDEPPADRWLDYKNYSWLIKDYAITVLPSSPSLKFLRTTVARAKATKSFIGFGNPDLDAATSFGQTSVAKLLRGFVKGDLPGIARELKNISVSLGGNNEDIHLLGRATERVVKSLDLMPYKVIAFATHGLMAGEEAGLTEPALVLTPPTNRSDLDDRLLTASEVAQLKLNADWVLLSACNTAAGDTQNSQGLSGLAKAFFYAGSRSLLVSHWKVESAATVKLITRMFANIANENNIGKSEALRRSMLSLMHDKKYPEYAHPAYWAPFVVVGEGG